MELPCEVSARVVSLLTAFAFLSLAHPALSVDNGKQADIIPFVSRLIPDESNLTVSAPDLALVNGRVWTGNKIQPWAEALASRGERITAIGSNDEIKKLIDSNTNVIDLQGKLAAPGFIDNHTHFMNGGFQLLSVDLRDASTEEEFARRIKVYADKRGPNRWITGGDWDHELWPGAPLPAKELIDRHTPNNPVFVSRLDGHMALANSVTLRLAKITKETVDPPGGTIVRDPKTGEPTGVLKDAAMTLVWPLVPEPSDAEYDEALVAAMKEAARVGVTSDSDALIPGLRFDLQGALVSYGLPGRRPLAGRRIVDLNVNIL